MSAPREDTLKEVLQCLTSKFAAQMYVPPEVIQTVALRSPGMRYADSSPNISVNPAPCQRRFAPPAWAGYFNR